MLPGGITNPNPITAMDYDASTGTLFTGPGQLSFGHRKRAVTMVRVMSQRVISCDVFFHCFSKFSQVVKHGPCILLFHIFPYFSECSCFPYFCNPFIPQLSYYILLYTNRPSYDFRCISNKTYVLLGSFLLGLPFGSNRHPPPRSKDGIILWTVKMGDMGGPLSLRP